jgi:hypothetical protein
MTLPLDNLSDHHKSVLFRIAMDAGLDLSDENLSKIRSIIWRKRLSSDFTRERNELYKVYRFVSNYQQRAGRQ